MSDPTLTDNDFKKIGWVCTTLNPYWQHVWDITQRHLRKQRPKIDRILFPRKTLDDIQIFGFRFLDLPIS